MSRTLHFGRHNDLHLTSRIDRFVIRRRTPCSFDRLQELAEADARRHMEAHIKPHPTHWSRASLPFGKK